MSVRVVTRPELTKNFAGGSLATMGSNLVLDGAGQRFAAPPFPGRHDRHRSYPTGGLRVGDNRTAGPPATVPPASPERMIHPCSWPSTSGTRTSPWGSWRTASSRRPAEPGRTVVGPYVVLDLVQVTRRDLERLGQCRLTEPTFVPKLSHAGADERFCHVNQGNNAAKGNFALLAD